MGRTPCNANVGLSRGTWTAIEDKILADYVEVHGKGRWKQLPKKAGLNRCGKSCRLRWLNYLRPDIKRGNFTEDEDDLIYRLHKLLGNRWSLIAGRIPGRTDNDIKNYWNSTLSKKFASSSSLSRVGKNPNKSYKNTTLNTTTAKNAMTKITSITNDPNSSTQVIRPRATRCPKVLMPPPPPRPPSNTNVIVGNNHVETFVKSLFNFNDDLHVEGGLLPDFTNILNHNNYDFNLCFSDFLNNDTFGNQHTINTENEMDCAFSDTVQQPVFDGHDYQPEMWPSSTNVGSDMSCESQLYPTFTDQYDNIWDL